MRRHGAATILALCAVLAAAGCTRDTPTPEPTPKPGQLTEIFPAGLRPAGMNPSTTFLPAEPVALLPVPGSTDLDIVTGPSRGPGAEIYRLPTPPRQQGSVESFPAGDGEVWRALGELFGVSSAARGRDGVTWLIGNTEGQGATVGTPRLLRISADGKTAVRSTLTGANLSRDRVRLTPLPDGRVAYLAGGRLHPLPGDTAPVPALSDIERLTPTDDGGYLAATKSRPGSTIRLIRFRPDGTRTDVVLPREVADDPLRGTVRSGFRMPVPEGSVVALTPDGHGGAYLAIAARPVDDALGVDISTPAMLVHASASGKTTFLMRGNRAEGPACSTLASDAHISTTGEVGRITDLLVHGDQLFISDAGCRRTVALQLGAATR